MVSTDEFVVFCLGCSIHSQYTLAPPQLPMKYITHIKVALCGSIPSFSCSTLACKGYH